MLLDKLKKCPIIKENRLDTLVEFSDEVKNFVATIECLNKEEHLHSPILLNELLNKLPTSYKLSWVEHISSSSCVGVGDASVASWWDLLFRAVGVSRFLLPCGWLPRDASSCASVWCSSGVSRGG